MNAKELTGSVLGGLGVLIVAVLALVSCNRLVVDSRERTQHKTEACIEQGYSGAVELDSGQGWICTGGKSDR